MDSPAKTRPSWVWLVAGGCGLVVFAALALVFLLVYFGAQGPDTDVYAGNEVPGRFLDTMRELGALEPDERIDYFYSDGLGDIRSGFYFVSDRRVVVYQKEGDDATLTPVPFTDITDVHLDREESFFIDSQMTLELGDGRVIAFPVSSEHQGDVRFFEAIRKRAEIDVED